MDETKTDMTRRVADEQVADWAGRVKVVEHDDDLTPVYAEALTLAYFFEAVGFAYDLAYEGMRSDRLSEMARRWREVEMDPPSYADALELLAAKVTEVGIR